MKICFCGMGSIGKRHLKNLICVAREYGIDVDIHALRKTDHELDEKANGCISRQITEESGLENRYDIVFVTNPTACHYETIRNMAARAENMFIEKPIFDSADYSVESLCLTEKGVYYVAGPLRFSSVIQTLEAIIPKERVYCVRAICSSYLPDWRPETDYRKSYSARKELGGGVAMDLIHEWDYLVRLFGFPEKVSSICGKYSGLEIDSDDTAVYIAEYKNMVAELHLDYFGRDHRRLAEIFTDGGVIAGDLKNQTICFPDERKRICFHEDSNDIYLREMRFFMDQVMKKTGYNNLDHCRSVLKLAQGRG